MQEIIVEFTCIYNINSSYNHYFYYTISVSEISQESLKIPMTSWEVVSLRRREEKKTKGQAMIYKILKRKLNTNTT